MGWCSGTGVFDEVCSVVLPAKQINKKQFLLTLVEAMESHDWDCHFDSAYIEHPLVEEIFKELHPTWFEDDE